MTGTRTGEGEASDPPPHAAARDAAPSHATFSRRLIGELREDAPLHAIVAAYGVAVFALALLLDRGGKFVPHIYAASWLQVLLGAIAAHCRSESQNSPAMTQAPLPSSLNHTPPRRT